MTTNSQELSDYLCCDHRHEISIIVHDYFGSSDPPLAIHIATLPEECRCQRDEVALGLLGGLYGRDGYSLRQSRGIYECGASSSVEEVAIEVVGGVAGTYVVRALDWIRGRLPRVSSDSPEPSSLTDEACLDAIRDGLERFYRPSGELTFLSHVGSAEDVVAEVRDSRRVVWHCTINRLTGISSFIRR